MELAPDILNRYSLWLERVEKRHTLALRSMNENEITNAFYSELDFGTGGIRAVMGLGSNKLNEYTMKRICMGTADYLASIGGKRACVCFDNRLNSKKFAQIAARCLAASNIEVILSKAIAPTPYLSYCVKHTNSDLGIMITASHNGKDYNGFKVYNSEGCQLTDIACKALKGFIDKVPMFAKIQKPNHKIIKYRSFKKDFIANCIDFLSFYDMAKQPQIKVAYTALCGTGAEYVLNVLKRLEIKPVVIKEQIRPNARFLNCPCPNPERDEAYECALKTAQAANADLILATDPDADRVGVMIKSKNGYVRLSGNELGALITDYMLKKTKKPNPIIIKTLVTTQLIEKIAANYGASVINTYTGFKYIGERALKTANDQFLLGLEDSCGYLPHNFALDKDGISVCGLICIMANEYKKSNLTLLDALNLLNEKYGTHTNKTITYRFENLSGFNKINDIMEKLRTQPPFLPNIIEKLDFLDPNNRVIIENNLPLTNMLCFIGQDFTVYIRPSGTEPLIKAYIMSANSNAPIKSILDKCASFFA